MSMKKIIPIFLASLMLLSCKTKTENMNTLSLTQEWDKTFAKSELVNHCKVTFHNRYGIELAADMYAPKNVEGKLPAIAVSGPFGAVKEQSVAPSVKSNARLALYFPLESVDITSRNVRGI